MQIGATPNAPTSKSCIVGDHISVLGKPPPDETAPGGRVVDGENGSIVQCKVVEAGGGHDIDLSVESNGKSFRLVGRVEASKTGTASLNYTSVVVHYPAQTPPSEPCQIDVSTPPLQVSRGKIYGAFACPALESAAQPKLYCKVDRGFFVFENCEG